MPLVNRRRGGGGSMTGAQILAALVAVDGTGSGLDADQVDGVHASAFAMRSNNLEDLADVAAARASLGLGTAATLNADNSAENVPVLGPDGKLASTVLPSLAIT